MVGLAFGWVPHISDIMSGMALPKHHCFWLAVCLILTWLPPCHSQNELEIRMVQPPYLLSFNINQVNGLVMTYGPNETQVNGKWYRTLALYDGKLFVGGKNQLFSVNPGDLSMLDHVSIPPSFTFSCDYCDNYIRVIQPLSDGVLLECGTNSLAPYCQQRTSQDLSTVGSRQGFSSGSLVVPSLPHQNSSWLLINDAGYQIYAGTNLEVTLPDTLGDAAIVRASLQTNASQTQITLGLKTQSDAPNVLNGPQFVGDPIEYNGRIYFFFREFAIEHINAGRIAYSRVAIVCKNDMGGRPTFTYTDEEFVTFVKARLECSIDGDFPYHYNHIQDIHQSVNQNVVFAVFTTLPSGVDGSAVCAYRLDEIEALFYSNSSEFRAQEDSPQLWRRLDAEPVTPRPATCPDTTSYTDDQYQDILGLAQLMDDTAENKLHYESSGSSKSNPLLIVSGERFSQIVMDEDVNSVDVMFIGTENGTVLKACLNEDRSKSRIVEEISLNTDGKRPVLTMLKSDAEQAVFVGTDVGVYKVPFQHCQDYTTCQACLDARDPYCKWMDDSCFHSTAAGLQDLENGAVNLCPNNTSTAPDGEILIHVAPKSQSRRLNISHQAVNLYLVAEAPAGRNLRVLDNEIKCGPCASLPFNQFRSSCSGKEFLVLHINGSSNEDMNCSCSCILAMDGGMNVAANFTLTVDDSPLVDIPEEHRHALTELNDEIIKYRYYLEEWLVDLLESCGHTNPLENSPSGCN